MVDHNILIIDPVKLFANPTAFNLHLLPGSAAIDADSAQLAPVIDIEGIPRPQGVGFDAGAYEFDPPTLPTPLRIQ